MIRFTPEKVAWRLPNDTSMRRKGHQVWFRVPAQSFVSTLRSGVPEATLLPFPPVVETGKRDEAIGWGGVVQRIFSADPEGPVEIQGCPQMMVGIQIPVYSHRGPGYESEAVLFTESAAGCENGPEAQPGKGTEIAGAEVLFSYDGDGEVTECPGADGELHSLISPTILHDEADEADPAEADPDP